MSCQVCSDTGYDAPNNRPCSYCAAHQKDLDDILGTHPRKFITKDSGKRAEFESGMVRDVDEGKPRYDLIPVMPLRRLADLYARGAQKYGDDNWQLANTEEEMRRFRTSAFRHFEQWRAGETDEDHAIAVCWNVFAYLYVEEKIARGEQ